MADIKPLIAYLVDQVRDQGGSPNKTALVKLVYLVDVECWRKLGKPATDLKWRFHHYGPYSAELERDINDNAFVRVFGDRHSGYGFSPSSQWEEIHTAFNARFDPAVRRVADGVVTQWGLQDLETILEYVYFETEPMQDARRGETLDFSRIQHEEEPVRRGPRLAFSDVFISDLRARWDQRRNAPNTPNKDQQAPDNPVYDEVYEEALRLMAQEDSIVPKVRRMTRLNGPYHGRQT